jgi:hypothetical protein
MKARKSSFRAGHRLIVRALPSTTREHAYHRMTEVKTMYRRSVAILLLLLAVSALAAAHANDNPAPAPSPGVAGSVGAEHRRLGELAGRWTVRQSLWLPGQSPQVDTGTALFTAVLGGRHLQQNLRIRSSVPFQGLGYMGYDNTTGRYYTSWIDINLTGMLVLHGDYDAAAKTYRFTGEMAGDGGVRIPMREELLILDRQHMVARYYETRSGQEALVVELDYTRP